MTIKDAIAKLADRLPLAEKEAEEVMHEIMAGAATPAQIAAYLMGLRLKGETVEEIAGSVRAMRDHAVRIAVGTSLVVDTCGTGGDGRHTFNISTTTAFVVAGAGLKNTAEARRIVRSGADYSVIDGPFAESRELVAGFSIWEVKDMDEAVAWARRSPMPSGSEMEIRPFYEAADLAEFVTPEELAAPRDGERGTLGVA